MDEMKAATFQFEKNEGVPMMTNANSLGPRRLKQMQEDEWHRQWAERNDARYLKERKELAMAQRAGTR